MSSYPTFLCLSSPLILSHDLNVSPLFDFLIIMSDFDGSIFTHLGTLSEIFDELLSSFNRKHCHACQHALPFPHAFLASNDFFR